MIGNKKWEYTWLFLEQEGTEVETTANNFGSKGWEMVSIDKMGRMWFKRHRGFVTSSDEHEKSDC